MKQTNIFTFVFAFLLVLSFTNAASVSYISPLNGSVYINELPIFNATINESYIFTGMNFNGVDGYADLIRNVNEYNQGLNNWSIFFLLSDGISIVNGSVQYFYYFSNASSFSDYNNLNNGLFVKYISPLNGTYINELPIFNATINESYIFTGMNFNGVDGYADLIRNVNEYNPGLNNWSIFFLLSDGISIVNGSVQYFYYDTTAPNITLNGLSIFDMIVGDSYPELGATAYDNQSGSIVNLTANITIDNSSLDVNTIGIYILTYSVNDSAGNTASVNRTVNVIAAPAIPNRGGSGGGYCATEWTVSEWSTCVNGIQTRTASYPSNYCTPTAKKPTESQTCEVENNDNNNENTPVEEVVDNTATGGFFPGITGAVIGTTAGRWSLGIVLFLILLGLAWWIVAAKRRVRQKKPEKKGKK